MIVVVGILHRMAECTFAIELLASKGFVRDAATLLLTLIELRLDLQYMALSPGREDDWIKHIAQNRKPWKVRQQIEEVYPDTNEREAEWANYRTFSMVKHGNPAGGTASFPIGVRQDALVLPDSGEKANLLPVYLFAAGATLYQAAVAAGKLVHPVGFDMTGEIEELRHLDAELSHLNEDHVRAMLQRYMQGKANSTV